MMSLGIRRSVLLLATSLSYAVAQNATNSDAKYDPLQYVDQLIGSSNGGQKVPTIFKNV